MATKKKTKAAAKAAPLKDVIGRTYGARVFTMKRVDPGTARTLIDKHGFRLDQRSDDGCTLWADKMAFDSWKGAK